VAEKVGDLPTRDSVLNMPAVQANPIVAAFGPLLRTAHARVAVPGWAGLLDPLSVAYSNVLAGKQDPASALDQVANKYAQLLPTYHAG
jgi:arabinogalactan oligomer/maltooligosaccharide transport system substrate-binding protein